MYNTKKTILFIILFTVAFTFCKAAVYYYNDFAIHTNNKKLANKLALWLNKDTEKVQKKLGYYPNLKINIYIAKNKKMFKKWVNNTNPNLQFSNAFASLKTNSMFIKNPQNLNNFKNLRVILLHEYIHLLIYKRFKNAPLWFHEGLAVYYSEGLSLNREFQYLKADFFNKSQKLTNMLVYPKNKNLVDAFYGKSVYAVKLLQTNNTNGFYNMWESPEKNFYTAFLKAFGFNIKGLDTQIKSYANKRKILFLVFSVASIPWVILPVSLLITYIKRKKQYKKLDELSLINNDDSQIGGNNSCNLLKND